MIDINTEIKRIKYRDKEIVLIPTAHVSTKSVELVRDTIEAEDFDAIAVELDSDRFSNIKNPDAWKNANLIDIIKKKKTSLLIANLILSAYQRNIAKKLGTNPGAEMLEGIRLAEEKNLELVLADRKIQTTFLRIWRGMGFFQKIKLLTQALFGFGDDDVTEEDLEKLMESANLEDAISQMAGDFPQIEKALLRERDMYLANRIKNANGRKIAAVLGAAHVPGVEKEIFKEQDLKSLDEIPRKSALSKTVPFIIPALILGLIVYGFTKSPETGMAQIKAWFLYNGLFAAAFTAICLGHPLSILTAFVAAPFTSLNPFLACGWFAGLVEASVRKPTVSDLENVHSDITSIKKALKNRFIKALIIVIFANIGSSIGTIVAGANIFKSIF